MGKKILCWLANVLSFDRKLPKIMDFFRWVTVDLLTYMVNPRIFREYGVTMYVGDQGSGKSISVVEYLERMRKKYPNVKIYTNFGYKNETAAMQGWRDLITIRNGLDGVIFVIDEIQNEYSSTQWKDLPDNLLQELTQQRKQRIKIVCSSQNYNRVAIQIREQCLEVVECMTFLERWVFQRCFNGRKYANYHDKADKHNKLFRKWKRNFIQDNHLRSLYDSYEKIERMRDKEFMTHEEKKARNDKYISA